MSEQNTDLLYIDEIARALKEKRAAIMVGSGFSKNASPDFPNWRELGGRIFERLYNKKPDSNACIDVLQLAEFLVANHNRPALDDIIGSAIPQGQFNYELHKDLLSLDWADIFTTNYDNLLERTAEDYFPRKYGIVKTQHGLLLTELLQTPFWR